MREKAESCLLEDACVHVCGLHDIFLGVTLDIYIHGILQAKILEFGSHSLLQGIVSTQGSKPGLLHCRQILYHLSHQGSPL